MRYDRETQLTYQLAPQSSENGAGSRSEGRTGAASREAAGRQKAVVAWRCRRWSRCWRRELALDPELELELACGLREEQVEESRRPDRLQPNLTARVPPTTKRVCPVLAAVGKRTARPPCRRGIESDAVRAQGSKFRTKAAHQRPPLCCRRCAITHTQNRPSLQPVGKLPRYLNTAKVPNRLAR